jgi:hypothetical protein
MRKTDEYLKHARECRALAKQMEQGDHRDQLLKMAETWEVLASERERTQRATGEPTTGAEPVRTTKPPVR